jgi:hypothetical protein
MNQCYSSGDFSKYFNENMKALSLPVPSTLFDNLNTAIANAGIMLETLNTLGKGATIGELINATTGLEKLKVAASLGAAFYVGAVIGSLAVASGRSMSCGSSIADLFVFMNRNNLNFKGSNSFYHKHPEILNPGHGNRKLFYSKAVSISKGAIA